MKAHSAALYRINMGRKIPFTPECVHVPSCNRIRNRVGCRELFVSAYANKPDFRVRFGRCKPIRKARDHASENQVSNWNRKQEQGRKRRAAVAEAPVQGIKGQSVLRNQSQQSIHCLHHVTRWLPRISRYRCLLYINQRLVCWRTESWHCRQYRGQ